MHGLLIFSESRNNQTQAAQAFVYIFALVQSFSRGSSNPHSFWTSQIDNIKLRDLDFLSFSSCVILPHLFNSNDKDCMRSRRELIHICFSSGSGFGSHFDKFQNLFWSDNRPFRDSFHKDTPFWIFSDLEIVLLLAQQIADYFVIDLDIGCANHKLCVFILATLDILKYILYCPRDYSSLIIVQIVFKSFHCEGFTGSSLPICKDGGIIALKSRTNWQSGSGVINFCLFTLIIINLIEGELMFEIIDRIIDILFQFIRIK